jgi:hypothetical protein
MGAAFFESLGFTATPHTLRIVLPSRVGIFPPRTGAPRPAEGNLVRFLTDGLGSGLRAPVLTHKASPGCIRVSGKITLLGNRVNRGSPPPSLCPSSSLRLWLAFSFYLG